MSGDQTKKHYDTIADTYEALLESRQRPKIEGVRDRLPAPIPSPRLDVGAGTGLVSKILKVPFVSLDFSAAMVAQAPPIRIVGDMRHLPFQDCYFALVVSVSALTTSDDFRPAVDEMLRVLKPDCMLYLSVLPTEDLWSIEHYLKRHGAVHSVERFKNGPDMLFVARRRSEIGMSARL